MRFAWRTAVIPRFAGDFLCLYPACPRRQKESRAGIERGMNELIGKDRTDPALIAEAEQVLKKSGFCDKEMADFVLDGLGSAASATLSRRGQKSSAL